MKILFIGTVDFSRRMLEKLISLNADISGLISMPDNKINADYFDFNTMCNEQRIPHHLTKDINSTETLTWIKEKEPDVIFCFGWSRLLKTQLLSIPPKGVIGYHPAQLPLNKGRHPLIWALVLGLEKTGSTFFYLNEGVDSGDIVSQSMVDISYKDDAATLYNKISLTAALQLESIFTGLKNDSLIVSKQDDSSGNYWRKRTKTDGKIDFRMSSFSIYNLVRALSKPYPGAHLEYRGKEIKVWKAEEVLSNEFNNIEPGKVVEVSGAIITIKAGNNLVKLVEHEFQSLPLVGEYL